LKIVDFYSKIVIRGKEALEKQQEHVGDGAL